MLLTQMILNQKTSARKARALPSRHILIHHTILVAPVAALTREFNLYE